MSKADELVERLRAIRLYAQDIIDSSFQRSLADNAICIRDEVDRVEVALTALQERVRELEGERGRLREALKPFAELSDIFAAAGASKIGGPDLGKALNAARTTLNGGTDGR